MHPLQPHVDFRQSQLRAEAQDRRLAKAASNRPTSDDPVLRAERTGSNVGLHVLRQVAGFLRRARRTEGVV